MAPVVLMAQVGLTEILGGAVCIHIEDFTQQQIHRYRCTKQQVGEGESSSSMWDGEGGDGGHQGLYKGTTGRVLVSNIIIIRLGRATSIV